MAAAGDDTLQGGGGDDTFQYNFKTGGKNTILDFKSGDDFIDLVGGNFPVFGLAASNPNIAVIDDIGAPGPVLLGQDNLGPPWNTAGADVPGGLEIDFGGGVLTRRPQQRHLPDPGQRLRHRRFTGADAYGRRQRLESG